MYTLIKGRCHTNLDNYTCDDVTVFAAVPSKGDHVYCKYKGNTTTLKVIRVIHGMRGPVGNEYPFIEVELHN